MIECHISKEYEKGVSDFLQYA